MAPGLTIGSRRVTSSVECWRMKKAFAIDDESSRATAERTIEEDMLAKGVQIQAEKRDAGEVVEGNRLIRSWPMKRVEG